MSGLMVKHHFPNEGEPCFRADALCLGPLDGSDYMVLEETLSHDDPTSLRKLLTAQCDIKDKQCVGK